MRVGSPKSKRTHTRPPRLRISIPRLGRNGDAEEVFIQVNEGIEIFKMQVGRNFFLFEGQHHLDETGDSRGGFQVSDVGLN